MAGKSASTASVIRVMAHTIGSLTQAGTAPGVLGPWRYRGFPFFFFWCVGKMVVDALYTWENGRYFHNPFFEQVFSVNISFFFLKKNPSIGCWN